MNELSSPPSSPPLWAPPSRAPPSRAVSLDPSVFLDDDEIFDEPMPMPLAANGYLQQAHLPAHALCKSKARSYTSPHLISQSSIGSAGKENRSSARNSTSRTSSVSSNGTADLSAVAEPAPVIPVDVFLAGSCNPTTWRRDTAMPMLAEAQINFYNPQVDEWYDALMYEEARAKEGAKIILMVIDSATRAIVCINESVEYISRGRRVILVVQNIQLGTVVDGAVVSESELADLNGARECLRRFALRRGVHLYDNVAAAVAETIACLVEENPKRFAPEVPRLRKRSSIILNEMAGQYRARRSTSRSLSSTSLFSLVSGADDGGGSDEGDDRDESPPHESAITDMSYVRHAGTSTARRHGGSVYLGGNLQSTSWREKVAIPKLQKAGLPFYIPYQDYLSVELQRLTVAARQPPSRGDRWQEMEAERENAELILFVIPDRTRSIAAMTEAVELICNGHALFLVLEPMQDECVLDDGTTLTGREFKDVVRARSYLKEMAERHDVEVFQSVQAAVTGIIERLNNE